MKLLKELEFEFPLWSLNPELAVIDTILDNHPAIYENAYPHPIIGG